MAIKEFNTLSELNFQKQLVFAYLTCARLYPNYVYFSAKYNFGSPDILEKSINYIHQNIFQHKIDIPTIKNFLEELDKATPYPENYDTVLVSASLDACNVIFETLNFLVDKDVKRLSDISTMATDTADMYIQEIDDLDFNTDKDFQLKIDRHPIMKREIAMQQGIITYLSQITELEPSDLQTLIRLQENNRGSLNL
ncbi:DUF416 family protein [Chitinophaga oryziterrae]|uniref:DUF416 family protein n=1 Tax=Chitinophaga oryziterrae TaxID=1031224 RepID=A0A6N8J424_9BACT|nr:DUF416 family protein [Chitinophaga oryziterrae]MVT38949.1 DUF416 family protein [Chitinophaga oryziterrae]